VLIAAIVAETAFETDSVIGVASKKAEGLQAESKNMPSNPVNNLLIRIIQHYKGFSMPDLLEGPKGIIL